MIEHDRKLMKFMWLGDISLNISPIDGFLNHHGQPVAKMEMPSFTLGSPYRRLLPSQKKLQRRSQWHTNWSAGQAGHGRKPETSWNQEPLRPCFSLFQDWAPWIFRLNGASSGTIIEQSWWIFACHGWLSESMFLINIPRAKMTDCTQKKIALKFGPFWGRGFTDRI